MCATILVSADSWVSFNNIADHLRLSSWNKNLINSCGNLIIHRIPCNYSYIISNTFYIEDRRVLHCFNFLF